LYKLDSDDSEKSCTSSKKRKTCETSTYPSREGPRSGLKNIMQNFTNQIIESQQKLLVKLLKNNVSLIKKCSINIIISFYSKRKCYSQGCRIWVLLFLIIIQYYSHFLEFQLSRCSQKLH